MKGDRKTYSDQGLHISVKLQLKSKPSIYKRHENSFLNTDCAKHPFQNERSAFVCYSLSIAVSVEDSLVHNHTILSARRYSIPLLFSSAELCV